MKIICSSPQGCYLNCALGLGYGLFVHVTRGVARNAFYSPGRLNIKNVEKIMEVIKTKDWISQQTDLFVNYTQRLNLF